MHTVQKIAALREDLAAWRRRGERIAFVPTMGNLHAGHLTLVREARRFGRVVVSIFVNPAQFGPKEDFQAYPRTLEADSVSLAAEGAELLFVPEVAEMYPNGWQASTQVVVPGLSDILCGTFRPGHFAGVATVVNKLFNIVQPDVALFGEKDFQQVLVVKRMVRDLWLPVEVLGVETVRDADGLALSSRNAYLSAEERSRAGQLYAVLNEVRGQVLTGERNYAALGLRAQKRLAAAGFRPDYVEVRAAVSLGVPGPEERDLVVLAAAWLGRARLIDNLRIRLPAVSRAG